MEVKTFEIRDAGTFIPALAIKLTPANEADRFLLARAGYGRGSEEQSKYILLIKLNGPEAQYDPYAWAGWPTIRTMPLAHRWIVEYFYQLASGDVVDVKFNAGVTAEKKISERLCDARGIPS